MTVTREGERVARSARAVVEELARCSTTSASSGRAIRACYAARRSATRVTTEATRDPVKPLLDGTLDLAIVYTPPARDDPALKPLFRDELVAVVPRSHPFAGRRYLTARDFRDQCLICHFPDLERSVLAREALRPAGVTPVRVQAVQLTSAVLAMVRAKRGITVITRWVLGKERSSRHVRAVRVTPRGLFRGWCAAMRVETATLPALARLVEVLGREAPRAIGRFEGERRSTRKRRVGARERPPSVELR